MDIFANYHKRHFGMDFVRAFAVISVLLGHVLIFFPKYFDIQWLLYFAVFGVELFFALSGFLIGNILIKSAKNGFNFSQVLQFWIKRWMRTIPVYLFVIVVIMLYKKQIFISYPFFVQNYFPNELKIFAVSWSLTVEEWFYLIFPLLMFSLYKILKIFKLQKMMVLISILIFMFIPIILRFLQIENTQLWDNVIRKQIHLRFDGIAYGLLLAFLYQKNGDLFKNNKSTTLFGILLLLGFIGVWWMFNHHINIFIAQPNFFNNVIFYPMINIYAALFVAFMIRFSEYSSSYLQRGILFVSLISYSLYLVHYPFYVWFSKYAESWQMSFVYAGLANVLIFIIGTILYKTIEKPFIELRNKWSKSQRNLAI